MRVPDAVAHEISELSSNLKVTGPWASATQKIGTAPQVKKKLSIVGTFIIAHLQQVLYAYRSI